MLQLVAGRLLSPFIGVSLATWTSIIGVFLAGISLGNWLGGRIADRYPSARTLGLLLLGGALATVVVLALVGLLHAVELARPLPLLPRIAVLTTLIFLPPSFILSIITPVAIRLALPDIRATGRVVGLIYALGTLGSLAGNFLTGFLLVAYLPINTIVLAVAGLLLALALAGGDWRRGAPAGPALVAAAAGDQPAAVAPPATTTRGLLDLPGNVPLAGAVAAGASFCTMLIELSASRLLAPHVGVSLFSWTGIIGVVLAAIVIGNMAGGRLADRWPRPAVLGTCLLLGGLASLAILPLLEPVTATEQWRRLGLVERIVALAAVLFFVPVLLLSTVSPQVTRLAVTDLARAGRTAGRIYAWSTAGAIAGTFAAGWWLISALGVHRLIALAGIALMALGTAVGYRRGLRALIPAAGLTLAVGARVLLTDVAASRCTMETDYFCIRVSDEQRGGEQVRVLVLDHLVHSYVKIGDPAYLGYEHEQVQVEITQLVAARTAAPQVLQIGGGGYTYPRWVDAFVPGAGVEVVEIDPGVTETAYRDLGLPRDTRIRSHNLDGRQFVRELARKGAYDLVVQDAVNDLSVPSHIMTKEYNDAVREILTADGIYLVSVIDLYRDGQLLRAVLRTMRQTFPEVELLAPYPSWTSAGSSVFVVYGSTRPLDLDEMSQTLARRGAGPMRTVAQPREQLLAYIADGPQIVLTDQYAPVDNLIAALFRSRN